MNDLAKLNLVVLDVQAVTAIYAVICTLLFALSQRSLQLVEVCRPMRRRPPGPSRAA